MRKEIVFVATYNEPFQTLFKGVFTQELLKEVRRTTNNTLEVFDFVVNEKNDTFIGIGFDADELPYVNMGSIPDHPQGNLFVIYTQEGGGYRIHGFFDNMQLTEEVKKVIEKENKEVYIAKIKINEEIDSLIEDHWDI